MAKGKDRGVLDQGFLACIRHMQCRVGDDDLKEDWMLVGQGNELAERVVFRNVVEDKVSANITSNYLTNVD